MLPLALTGNDWATLGVAAVFFAPVVVGIAAESHRHFQRWRAERDGRNA